MIKLKFVFSIFVFVFAISCSQKAVTLRRLDDIHKTEKKLEKNPNNEVLIRRVLDAAQNGNREVRAEALWILANTKTQLAYSHFLRFSVEDPDFNVRSMAILGLSEIESKNPQSIDRVRRAILDTDLQVQIEALHVASKLQADELLTPVLNTLSSKNKWVRMAAIEALKDYKDARVDRSLNLISTTEADYAVRSLALQVIEYRANNAMR